MAQKLLARAAISRVFQASLFLAVRCVMRGTGAGPLELPLPHRALAQGCALVAILVQPQALLYLPAPACAARGDMVSHPPCAQTLLAMGLALLDIIAPQAPAPQLKIPAAREPTAPLGLLLQPPPLQVLTVKPMLQCTLHALLAATTPVQAALAQALACPAPLATPRRLAILPVTCASRELIACLAPPRRTAALASMAHSLPSKMPLALVSAKPVNSGQCPAFPHQTAPLTAPAGRTALPGAPLPSPAPLISTALPPWARQPLARRAIFALQIPPHPQTALRATIVRRARAPILCSMRTRAKCFSLVPRACATPATFAPPTR